MMVVAGNQLQAVEEYYNEIPRTDSISEYQQEEK